MILKFLSPACNHVLCLSASLLPVKMQPSSFKGFLSERCVLFSWFFGVLRRCRPWDLTVIFLANQKDFRSHDLCLSSKLKMFSTSVRICIGIAVDIHGLKMKMSGFFAGLCQNYLLAFWEIHLACL